ncbi:flavin monoamine oxidase family protein [Ruegeria hyattellae]|uniref:flavin monoamine oxidase family protein n=1 Tax=Ruegeria hyattellae TaxID=3233337 RepID=UPI00355AD82D
MISAGAAGLTAAYHLLSAGIDVRVLEASDRWGGRVMQDTTLASVPLDLGAEWIHDDPTVLGEILGVGATDLGITTIDYTPQSYQFWHKGALRSLDVLRHAYSEVKFQDTTWYGFFEQHVLPRVAEVILTDTAVTEIAPNGRGVRAVSRSGRTFDADKLLVTVPLSVLKNKSLSFSGAYASAPLDQLQDVQFGAGLKVFCTFRERFYPDILLFGSRLTALSDAWSQKIYYDASFRKPIQENILGLFSVSDTNMPRTALSDAALITSVLDELTEIFGDTVRDNFIAARAQNWSAAPHIFGSYSMDNQSASDISEILAPIEGKVFFAGEALGDDAQATVHGAAFSAISAIEQLQEH